MIFHLSPSDSKSPQVSRTFLSIRPDLNNAVIWMASAGPAMYKYSSPLTKLLMIVLSAPITIGITVTFLFHNFFSSQTRFNPLATMCLYISCIYVFIYLCQTGSQKKEKAENSHTHIHRQLYTYTKKGERTTSKIKTI